MPPDQPFDRFLHEALPPDGPATRAFAITPSNTAYLPEVSRSLWIGAAGDVEVEHLGTPGVAITYRNVQGLLPVRVVRVRAENTTASQIVGMV